MAEFNGVDDGTSVIIGEALRVHSILGPGLLESAYEQCLAYALTARGLAVKTQVLLPLSFDSLFVPNAYRIDLIVNETVVVEIKATDALSSSHLAQVLTYLKLSRLQIGLLINFNEVHLRNGIKRIVNTRNNL